MAEHDEDIDDVMSSILQRHHGSVPSPLPHQKPPEKKRLFRQDSTFTQPKSSIFAENYPYQGQVTAAPRTRRKLRRSVWTALVLLVLLAGLGSAGFYFRGQISVTITNLLAPSSPFSEELAEKVEFPLFYPINLPAGFKLDRDSIKQPETKVVIYALTDDTGKTINITLQTQAPQLDLDKLHSLLKERRELDTPLGKAKIGNSDKITIANLLTGKTWILVNMPVNTVSNEDFDTLLRSLKQG